MSEEILHGFTCEFVHEGDTCKLVDVLVAENARLRVERDMYRYLVGCMVQLGIPDQSAAENAKLRELVRDIRICARDNQCSPCYLVSEKCDFSDHMSELGIEVDG